MSTRQVCGLPVTWAAMADATAASTVAGDRRAGSGSPAMAASTRAARPQSHSSYSARNSASLPGNYRYGVPLDTPAASAISAIVVVW
jgi:hypothetical protein